MTRRYLALVQRHGSPQFEARVARIEAKCRSEGLLPCHQGAGVLVLASSGMPVHACGAGITLGEIHARQGDKLPGNEAIANRLRAYSGDAGGLLARFWGNFVAFVAAADGSGLKITRAPFGRLGCLWSADDDLVAIASDLDLLMTAGSGTPAVDTARLARRLAWPGQPLRDTCLEGVRSIPGGSTLVLGTTREAFRAEECAWTPWSNAGREHWYETREEAQDAIRAAIFKATAACRRDAAHTVLLLSGGVDSSILAATLSSVGGAYSCVNLVKPDSSADERRFARAVASRLGCRLVEIEWSLEDIDLGRSESAGLPNPGNRVFMQGTNAAAARAVALAGADLLIDGGGGDNVFLGVSSVAPVTDALLREGLGAALATGRCVATLSQTSLAKVLHLAFQRRFRRSPAFRWHPDSAFLSREAGALAGTSPPHAWLAPPPGAETGTAAHIALLAAAQGWAEECDLLSPVRQACPLATVPVVEACLKVPSWWWYGDGRNRLIARQAFAERLPAEVIMRQTKGSPDSYVAEIFAKHRSTVRAMLLDGQLRRLGLLDLPAIERATASAGPTIGTSYDRLLQLSQVEAWLSTRH